MDDAEHIEWLKRRLIVDVGFFPQRLVSHKTFIFNQGKIEVDLALVDRHKYLLISFESVSTHDNTEKKDSLLKSNGIECFNFPRTKNNYGSRIQLSNFLEWVKEKRSEGYKRPHWRIGPKPWDGKLA